MSKRQNEGDLPVVTQRNALNISLLKSILEVKDVFNIVINYLVMHDIIRLDNALTNNELREKYLNVLQLCTIPVPFDDNPTLWWKLRKQCVGWLIKRQIGGFTGTFKLNETTWKEFHQPTSSSLLSKITDLRLDSFQKPLDMTTLSKCTSLRSLHFQNVKSVSNESNFDLNQLTKVTVSYETISLNMLNAFMKCPNLRILDCHHCKFDSSLKPSDVQEFFKNGPIRELRLLRVNNIMELMVTGSDGKPFALEKLHWDECQMASAEQLENFYKLLSLTPNLTHLSLHRIKFNFVNFVNRVNQTNTKLESLTLNLSPIEWDGYDASNPPRLPSKMTTLMTSKVLPGSSADMTKLFSTMPRELSYLDMEFIDRLEISCLEDLPNQLGCLSKVRFSLAADKLAKTPPSELHRIFEKVPSLEIIKWPHWLLPAEKPKHSPVLIYSTATGFIGQN